MPTRSSPHLFHSESLSWAINYNHYSHTVRGACKLNFFFHAYSTMQHHGGFSANLQTLSISSQYMVPLQHPLIYTEAPVLRAEASPGWVAVVVPNPHAKLQLQTQTQAHTVDISWPTSFPACFYVCICCAFHSQQLHSSSGWYVPSSSSLRRAERQHEFLSKTNAPRRPNLSPLLWQFITSSKLYTPRDIHTDIFTKNTDSTQKTSKKRSRSIYCNMQCVPSCVVLHLTPTHKNMKQFVCLRRCGKRNPLRSPASGIYGSKNSPILHISQKHLRQAETENCFIECRQEVLLDSLTPKIITHIYILTPTCSQT